MRDREDVGKKHYVADGTFVDVSHGCATHRDSDVDRGKVKSAADSDTCMGRRRVRSMKDKDADVDQGRVRRLRVVDVMCVRRKMMLGIDLIF